MAHIWLDGFSGAVPVAEAIIEFFADAALKVLPSAVLVAGAANDTCCVGPCLANLSITGIRSHLFCIRPKTIQINNKLN